MNFYLRNQDSEYDPILAPVFTSGTSTSTSTTPPTRKQGPTVLVKESPIKRNIGHPNSLIDRNTNKNNHSIDTDLDLDELERDTTVVQRSNSVLSTTITTSTSLRTNNQPHKRLRRHKESSQLEVITSSDEDINSTNNTNGKSTTIASNNNGNDDGNATDEDTGLQTLYQNYQHQRKKPKLVDDENPRRVTPSIIATSKSTNTIESEEMVLDAVEIKQMSTDVLKDEIAGKQSTGIKWRYLARKRFIAKVLTFYLYRFSSSILLPYDT